MVIIVDPTPTADEITTYADMVDIAEGALGRDVASGAITLLTSDLNKRLRVREMLKETTQSTAILPSGFLEGEIVKLAGRIIQPASVRSNQPNTYAVKNGKFVFSQDETAPDLFLRYYAKLAVLEGTDTNAVLAKYPDVYLYGLLFHHSRLVRDEAGAAAWGPAFEQAIADAIKSDVSSRDDSAPLRVRARSVV